MGSHVDENRWDTTRKKYILSLKNRSRNGIGNTIRMTKNTSDDEKLLDKQSAPAVFENEDSQNICLRLSDSFTGDDIIGQHRQKKVVGHDRQMRETEIVVISDSSDDEQATVNRLKEKEKTDANTKFLSSESSQTLSSIDVSEIWSDDDKKSAVSKWKDRYISLRKNDQQKNGLLTPINKPDMDLNNISDKENNVPNINALTINNRPTSPKHKENIRSIRATQCHTDGEIIPKNLTNVDPFVNSTKRQNNLCNTPSSVKPTLRSTPLTKKDARNIVRVIESKRAVYNSPQYQRKNNLVKSDLENSIGSNASQEADDIKRKVKHPVWIKETDSESSETSEDSHQSPSKLIKTHVTRFLDPVSTESNSIELSERKKQEISRWLLSSPADSRSETSVSYIPLSEHNSLSSGNSSLDRLELNYETPNNRDKFKSREYVNGDKSKTVTTPIDRVRSVEANQTSMNRFLNKVKSNSIDITSITPTSVMKTKQIAPQPVSAQQTSNIQIEDCADILDELYGDAWRKNAGHLLPVSEPRKLHLKVQDRAVQTERKKIIRTKNKTSSPCAPDNNSNDKDFKTSVYGTKSVLNPPRESEKSVRKWRDSFINDSSSDCDDGETTYQTALSTPHLPNLRNRDKKDTPMSALTIRAIQICDSDTEDDNHALPVKKINDNRKRLSYSDDETDSRSSPGTSEYDPEDIIPPKSVMKQKNVNASKLLSKLSTSTRLGLTKSFLASLSPLVPLENAHPDAKKYRIDYKNTKDELCKYLYKLFNDKIFSNKLPTDMLIEWNVRMRGTAGSCYNKTRKTALGTVERSSRIVLATKILDAPDRLRDTLVHEMCHAATWLINEVSDGHGPFWQAWASKAMKAFPELPAIKRCHDYKIATKYTYRCVACGYSIGRHSKSLDVDRKRCGHCYGKFELLINRTTKSGTVQVKTPSNRKATGFALFVKENYHLVKKERHDMGHKEVMQLLGQQFSAIKISKDNNNVDH